MLAAINIDGVGIKDSPTSVALLKCPDHLSKEARDIMASYPRLIEVEPYYEGNHSLFWPQGIPSIALSSQEAHSLLDVVIHTSHDALEWVDVDEVLTASGYARELLARIWGQS